MQRNFRLPTLILPLQTALRISKPLSPAARFLLFIKSDMQKDLDQANIQLDSISYLSLVLFTTLFYFSAFTILIFFVSRLESVQQNLLDVPDFADALFTSPEYEEIAAQRQAKEITAEEEALAIAALVERRIFFMLLPLPFIMALIVFFHSLFYPQSLARAKARLVEKNLLYMLRHTTVQVRSGSTLFDSLKSVAASNYGVISEDIGELVKEVASGASIQRALDKLILHNRSEAFRKIIWQIQNALVSGANLGELFLQLSQRYFEDQKVAIQKFGKDLNSFSMIFLVLTVIFPIMAIIMLVVAALLPLPAVPPEFLFGFLGFLFLVQFNLIQMIKGKRPPVNF